ncbi:hypothetical protein ABZ348_31085 [Streptomyces sp. NPDC005963]|uniref:hypothetical protein n=1 Tax=Streptomyces sp. NPDC005963 TaxID=3156721 RepID=UPI0033F4D972
MQPHRHIRTYIPGRGQYQTSAERFDQLIAEYLPASPASLRAELQRLSDEEHGGHIDYSDLATVTECLLILGELRGFATN